MAQGPGHQVVAESIRAAIVDTPKKSKQVLLKTLLKQFGYKTRQKHFVEAVDKALSASGVMVSPPLDTAGREDWIRP